MDDATQVAVARLDACFGGSKVDWAKFYEPNDESQALGSRYQLAYSALAQFVAIKADPSKAETLRPYLDNIYGGLLERRCWGYWHEPWQTQRTWPLERGNLTYAGRLATFVGFYADAFGEPPTPQIDLDGRSTTYAEISSNLWDQASSNASCGVTCFNNVAMLQCNAHLLINNVLHDRLYGSDFSPANEKWLASVEQNLLRDEESGPLFYYGTQPNKAEPNLDSRAVGTDIWALFLMSGIVAERVAGWFETWQRNLVVDADTAWVEVGDRAREQESSTNEIATAWAYCLAKELGEDALAVKFRRYLAPRAAAGFKIDPYTTSLFLLGEHLSKGLFSSLIHGGTVSQPEAS